MKKYYVTIYDGKSSWEIEVRAKSLNDAKNKGREYCRENKIIGGTVTGVVKAGANLQNEHCDYVR